MQQDQQVSWTLWKNAMALTQQVLPTALWSQFKSVRLVDSLIQLAICTGLKMLNPPLSASLGPFGTQATSSTCQTKASTKKDKKRTKKRLILNPLNPGQRCPCFRLISTRAVKGSPQTGPTTWTCRVEHGVPGVPELSEHCASIPSLTDHYQHNFVSSLTWSRLQAWEEDVSSSCTRKPSVVRHVESLKSFDLEMLKPPNFYCDGFRKKQTDWTYKIHTVFAKLRTTSNNFARGLGDKRSKFLGPSCKFARKPQTSAHSSKVSFRHKTTVFVVLNASVAKEC